MLQAASVLPISTSSAGATPLPRNHGRRLNAMRAARRAGASI
jgi:hypothetical protein